MVIRRFGLFAVLALVLTGCGPETISLIAPLGTARHHVNAGNRLLAYSKPDAALQEFTRAQDLDPRFVPAVIGQALAFGFQGHFAQALESLQKADSLAETTDEKVEVHIGAMRLYTIGKERIAADWLNRVERECAAALANKPRSNQTYYNMGRAYEQAGDKNRAATMYRRAVDLGAGNDSEAADALDRLEAR